jgi:pyrroloquinoline quinone biosynthesis protein B
LKIIVTGSAAGGGFPQWNCRCRMCILYWQKDPRVVRRTQSSLAVTGDGTSWVILDCSPDIREQIAATPELQPKGSLRSSPIQAVVLTGGEIDQLGGLFSLREQTPFEIYAPAAVLDVIAQNSMFNVLDAGWISKFLLLPEQTAELPGGLTLRAFPVPGKLPLYLQPDATQKSITGEFTVGLCIGDGNGNTIAYIPACAAVDDKLRTAIASTKALFFDGTLWTDDELLTAGVGKKTGRRMGHMPISGPDGSIAALKDVLCGERFFVHINNTNPLNCATSSERRIAENSGWRIPQDGLEISL